MRKHAYTIYANKGADQPMHQCDQMIHSALNFELRNSVFLHHLFITHKHKNTF